MTDYTERELQKAKDLLNIENPTDEQIEAIDVFFRDQFRLSEDTYTELQNTLSA